MSLGGRGVDQLRLSRRHFDKRQEQTSPDSLHRPASKTIVDGSRWPIVRRAVLPATSSLQNVDDAADNPAIIHTMGAGAFFWQVRVDLRPLLVAEPKFVRHVSSSVWQLES